MGAATLGPYSRNRPTATDEKKKSLLYFGCDFCGWYSFRKIIKIVATRCHVSQLKCTVCIVHLLLLRRRCVCPAVNSVVSVCVCVRACVCEVAAMSAAAGDVQTLKNCELLLNDVMRLEAKASEMNVYMARIATHVDLHVRTTHTHTHTHTHTPVPD